MGPKTTPANPTEADYEIGVIDRYFARVGNDIDKPLFEVSKEDFSNQNNLYIYTIVYKIMFPRSISIKRIIYLNISFLF